MVYSILYLYVEHFQLEMPHLLALLTPPSLALFYIDVCTKKNIASISASAAESWRVNTALLIC